MGLLTSCASTPSKTPSIQQRAQARWDALLAGDLSAAYGYLSPGTRSSIGSLQYQRSILLKKVHWTAARVLGSDCEETTCKVSISLDYTVYAAVPGVKSFSGSQTVEESWVLVDGLWYLVPKR